MQLVLITSVVSPTSSIIYIKNFGDAKFITKTAVKFQVSLRAASWVGNRFWMIGGMYGGKQT